MADVKIIDLPEATVINDTDDLIVEQADGTKKAAVSLLPAGVPDGGTQGQVLTKQSASDGDADWETIVFPTVDQTYGSSSSNAQSGTAVAGAISGASITTSQISDFPSTMPPSSHTHGNITNGGDITSNVAIANGDRLVINDESASKLNNSSITFGTSTTTFLSNKGTWATPTISLNLLWTNSAPSSTFAGQSVNVSLSEYNLILIVVKNINNQTGNYTTHILEKNEGVVMLGAYNNGYKTTFRSATASNTKVTFGGGYITDPTFTSAADSDNGVAIPYKIYGIK